MRNNKQTVPTTKNTSTTPDETIRYMELSDEDAIRVVGGGVCGGCGIPGGGGAGIRLPVGSGASKVKVTPQDPPKCVLIC